MSGVIPLLPTGISGATLQNSGGPSIPFSGINNIILDSGFVGIISVSLDDSTSNFVGEQTQQGNLASILDNSTSNFVGEQTQQGNLSSILDNSISNFVGEQTQQGNLASILDNSISDFTAEHIQQGNLLSILDNIIPEIEGTSGSGRLLSILDDSVSDLRGYIIPYYAGGLPILGDTIIENIMDITVVQEVNEPTSVIMDYSDSTVIETDSDTIIIEEDKYTILESALQGPPGPPTGPGEDVDNLPFVGSGFGNTKTTTGAYNNILYEAFGIDDELFVIWVIPAGADKSKDIYFEGAFFALDDGINRTSSWEVHVTSHNGPGSEITGIIYITDIPLLDTSYIDQPGTATIPASTYLTGTTETVHIKLKRVVSTNDPTDKIAVSDIRMRYSTDGAIGEQGATGPQGPPGGEEVALAKQIDWIDDEHVYIGEANPGTLTSLPNWRIKYTVFQADGDTSITWAEGSDSFDKVWDNRLTYTYS